MWPPPWGSHLYCPHVRCYFDSAAYQVFFALRKDADPDIPVLIAAKSGYAKLK